MGVVYQAKPTTTCLTRQARQRRARGGLTKSRLGRNMKNPAREGGVNSWRLDRRLVTPDLAATTQCVKGLRACLQSPPHITESGFARV
jgi:hypothetical protein